MAGAAAKNTKYVCTVRRATRVPAAPVCRPSRTLTTIHPTPATDLFRYSVQRPDPRERAFLRPRQIRRPLRPLAREEARVAPPLIWTDTTNDRPGKKNQHHRVATNLAKGSKSGVDFDGHGHAAVVCWTFFLKPLGSHAV